MKEMKPDWFSVEMLKKWGVQIIKRPDYYDGRNRCVTVIIDETVPADTVVFENGITFRMSTVALDDVVDNISVALSSDFVKAFVDAVNAYAKWNVVLIRKVPGTKWLKDAIDRIDFMLEMYKVDMKHFSHLDWMRCCAHFGGADAFRQLVTDAIAYKSDELFSLCMICKNCKCEHGRRTCKKVYVPVDEDGEGIQSLRRMDDDQPISNSISDILPTFQQREQCAHFVKNQTKFIDAVTRLRDARKER